MKRDISRSMTPQNMFFWTEGGGGGVARHNLKNFHYQNVTKAPQTVFFAV